MAAILLRSVMQVDMLLGTLRVLSLVLVDAAVGVEHDGAAGEDLVHQSVVRVELTFLGLALLE